MVKQAAFFMSSCLCVFVLAHARTQESKGSIAGSAVCADCHNNIYERWNDSIHGKMIQPATRNAVVSRVAGSRFWRNGVFFIKEDGVEHRVDFTLGNRRIQHYLASRPNGQIVVLHSTWDVKRQQWFDSAEIVPNAPPHFVQQWNMSCFYCHVTQQHQDVKGFNPRTLGYRTAWVESSASCERCHGPMSEHASGAVAAGSLRAQPAASSRYDKLMICGQCHWAKIVMATGYNTRKRYFDYYSPGLIQMDATETIAPSWWADGRPRRFSNEAAAFFLSGCFQSGKAFCTSCHDPHWNRTDGNEELMKRSDQYCTNCHASYAKESHTRHGAASSGSSCVACHMPYTVHGVKAKMRDHTMLGPEPENTVRYEIPNACNECHADRTPQWAADQVDRWYPKRNVRPRLRASAFTLAKNKDPGAVESLIQLAEDVTENPLIRASAAGYLVQYPGDRAAKTLIRLSKDSDPLVRLEAARALETVSGTDGVNAVKALGQMVSDTYRTVRIQAAASLVDRSFSSEPPRLNKQHPDFARAVQEYRSSLELEGDDPTMQVRLGSLDSFLGDFAAAKEAYRLALRLDPKQADAYVGLALIEANLGNVDEAVKNARKAAGVSDKEMYRQFIERMKSAKPR